MTEPRWTRAVYEGYDAWVGRTERLSLTVIPALGGKAVSLSSLATGREWLWRSGKPLGNAGYGSPFASGDESGWDEMFPGIDACAYPDSPWQGRAVPDHGEVWSLPWRFRLDGDALRGKADGVNFPYTLEKTITMPASDTLRIQYAATNRSDAPFSFLWAAHPLFRAREGMRIRVPDHLTEIEVSYSAGRRLGIFGDKQPWPVARTSAGEIDLRLIESSAGRHAEKYYFTERVKEGWASLEDPATGEAVVLRFPADRVPYLAVWANAGGYGGYEHVALEPATGRMDDLAHAMSRGESATVEPGGRYAWHLELSLR
ncbi:hypothetical protein [Cohnella nanjingensis]|uniref:Galactose mutarotase n=1 Tax=Cohnella nanjingensis TaxID=1387779 RepID=A0A7X0RKF9_9BACL|nr:hypothetical protein [Cohnella nanjingensis]MBB6669122.1 hypothetical protein [Cohnella nanjingensis]